MKLGHRPALDGLRGIAVLLVVACHALAIPGGFLGVEIFFALSGFLITTLLLEERDAGGIDLRGFYIRRVRRLYPALGALLAGWFALSLLGLTPSGLRTESLGVLLSGAYLGNVSSAWFYALPDGLKHLWSLGLEEQFYIVWPLLLALLLRRAPSRRLALGLGAAAVTVAALRSGLAVHGESVWRLYEAPVTSADALLLGAAVAALRHGGLPRPLSSPRLRAALGAIALVALLQTALFAPGVISRGYYVWGLTAINVAAALLVLNIATDESVAARICSVRFLRWCGKISYSLYLVHPVILVELVIRHHVLTPLPAIALSFLVAALLHRYVEERFRRSRQRVRAAPVLVD